MMNSILNSRALTLLLCFFGLSASLSAEEQERPAVADPTYVLRSNDAITLEVFGEPDLSGSVKILTTGQASFPLIGSVEVSGLTVAAAAARIRDLYAADYLVDPKVTLTVDAYTTDFITVIGSVNSPGRVPVPVTGDLDLATAMASVGGLTATSDPNSIQLFRASGGTSRYSMADIQRGTSGRVPLRAGDRIIVNQSPLLGKTITMLGEVGKSGPMAFPLNGKLDLVSAIAMAGGMTNLANPKKVTIRRNGSVMEVDYNEVSQGRPLALLPDDVVTVGRRFF
jgi:polysaccharide export outer membrane protein